ncbi:MAG TPA: hypothetical protein VFA09_12790 [Ktedonobacteraceae bacterium]|nr:hypothetical protein [Ktedonobacteraceae bacterium]
MTDRVPTFADLCSALAEGRIPATVDGSMYSVNALELRRYLNKFRSLPTISYTYGDAPISILHKESSNWSSSTQTH